MCNPLQLIGIPSRASGAEQALATQSGDLSRTLESHYKKSFADQTDTLARLTSTISRIESGRQGPGMSGEELAARRAEIQANATMGARNVEQSVMNRASGQTFGGGASDDSGLASRSGVRQQLNEEIEAAGSNEQSRELNALTSENYRVGRENTAFEAGALDRLSGRQGEMAQQSLSGEETQNQIASGQAANIRKLDDAHVMGLGSKLMSALGMVIPGAGMASQLISKVAPNADTGFLDTIAGLGG